jgi:thiamine biosynthesis protein ThiI
MKRGIRPAYLHVHGFGSNDAPELKKLVDTVSILSRYSGPSRIYFAPFHIFQSMSMRTERRYETVLFKRFLYLLAEAVAVKDRADCIITGESLGQVASQTIKNLSATSAGINSFVVRPLIGLDKQEIIDISKSIGTMGLSVQKYRDVCSIDLKRVVLNASNERVEELSERMDIGSAVGATLARISSIDVCAAWK